MGFQKINAIQQFNFQINRLLAYGEKACDAQEVNLVAPSIKTLADWNRVAIHAITNWLDGINLC